MLTEASLHQLQEI